MPADDGPPAALAPSLAATIDAVTQQLTFRLDPGLPRLPDLAPMWPVGADEPFDSAGHLFEPIWGGHRALAYVGPASAPGRGEVRLLDPTGRDLAPALPELAGLAVRVAARSAILDGELVCTDDAGRADDASLRARLSGARGRPVAYLVFDLLDLDGASLLRTPLVRRRAALRRILRPADEVVVVPAIAGEGRALHDAVSAQGIAGVLARQASSPYLPGVRSRLWRSIPAGPAPGQSAEATGTGDAADASTPDATSSDATPPSGTGPVLALFRRLPLLDDEAE